METENKDVVKTEEVVTEEKQETTEKTYTKEDLDNSFNAGVKKANTDWQKDEKYKEFLKWKKQSQSDSEKMTELTTTNNNQAKEIASLKAELQVIKSDVKKEFAKFVTSEVVDLVDETTDFETALTKFKKENPQYFGETVIKKVQSSPVLNNGTTGGQTSSSIMNDIIRGAKNNK